MGLLAFFVNFVFIGLPSLVLETQSNALSENTVRFVEKSAPLPIPFNLEEIYQGQFVFEPFNGTWISSNEIMYVSGNNGDILKFNVEKREISLLAGVKNLPKGESFYSFELSADQSQLLIKYGPDTNAQDPGFRQYYIFDVWTQTSLVVAHGKSVSFAEWSPVGHSFAYVSGNNLVYHRAGHSETELTRDGSFEAIYNGIPDWIYKTRVMGIESEEAVGALWFSPDGQFLAFASYDDRKVQSAFRISYDFQYPKVSMKRHPKAGTANPIVSLNLKNLMDPDGKCLVLAPPIDVVGRDNILYSVKWLTNELLAVVWTNRVQNASQLVLYNQRGGIRSYLKMEEKNGWLEIGKNMLYSDGKIFLTKYQHVNAIEGGYNHLTSFDVPIDGPLTNETDLTPFSPSDQSLVASNNGTIYYLATGNRSPSQKNLYSIRADGKSSSTCISCSQRTSEGNNCTYVDIAFSKDASNVAITCLGPDPPTVRILINIGGKKKMFAWKKNKKLRKKLKNRLTYSIMNVDVKCRDFSCKARMFLPPNFDKTKKYPMIVHVNAAPNTVAIKDIWSCELDSYFVTNRSVIWTVIDGRGSAHKGSNMLFQIYRGLGTVEIEDQIAVTRYLQDNYSWIDANRTGIWGSKYGGYATAMVLATDHDKIFKCGISISPVTSWMYYDSIYTERYMGLPIEEDNLGGYERGDVTRLVEGICGKKFMIIHGTADATMHHQHSMIFSRSLMLAGIDFEQTIYPDENNNFVNVNPHLVNKINDFFSNCLELSRTYSNYSTVD